MFSSVMAEQVTFVRVGVECGKDGVGWWRLVADHVVGGACWLANGLVGWVDWWRGVGNVRAGLVVDTGLWGGGLGLNGEY